MVYLLDENVLINAARDIYPVDRFPEIWRWFLHHIEAGNIKTLRQVCANLEQNRSKKREEDSLSRWIRQHGKKMLVGQPPEPLIRRVLTEGYEVTYSEEHLRRLANDALLIAAGLESLASRTVVTMESADRRDRKGLKRHIPHVCDRLKVKWTTPFAMLHDLDFRTADW